jgi:polyphosphate glucokinase
LVDVKLVPNLDVALYPFRQKTYEKILGNAARKKIGNKNWNKRLCDAITALNDLFNYDRLYIGGGNSKKIRLKLPRVQARQPNLFAHWAMVSTVGSPCESLGLAAIARRSG